MSESIFSNLAASRPIDYSILSTLSTLKLIDLNLIYLIKETVLPINGYVSRMTETVSPGSQETDPITGLTVTPYQGKYYDWVYYNPDPSNPALTGLLTVPTLSSSGSMAFVDYPNGKVYYSGTTSSQITMTYDYYSVYVQDGFPDWGSDINNAENMRLPIVSVDFGSRVDIPFYLGGKFQENRRFGIDILAGSDAQRDDLLEIIETSLRYTYNNTINYSFGFPVLSNGDKNINFDRGLASRWNPIRFDNVTSRIIHAPMASDKYRHRALINLTIESY